MYVGIVNVQIFFLIKLFQIKNYMHCFLSLLQIIDREEDFSWNNSLLTFVSGAAPDTQCITIDIVDDMDFEDTQSFSVSTIIISPPFATTSESTTVVIQDNNGIALFI